MRPSKGARKNFPHSFSGDRGDRTARADTLEAEVLRKNSIMHIAFLNPQGNFDPHDSHLTEHPDFGGQLVYVKYVAMAMAEQGHKVDILTRQIIDSEWPQFADKFDSYPNVENVRIIRLPAGPKHFLRKESLWRHLVKDWVPNVMELYQAEGGFPHAFTAHYGDGGLCGVLLEAATGIPFTFTGHSLGAQKMDKLEVAPENIEGMDRHFRFARRLVAERLSMNRSAVNITSTEGERFEQYSHYAYRGAVNVKEDKRFSIIAPGVDANTFSAKVTCPSEEKTQQIVRDRMKRDLDEDRLELPVILASSRLAPKKNLQGLVDAFACSETLQKQANLVLITSGLENPLQEETPDDETERVLMPIRKVVKENNLWGKISAFSLPDQPALAACYRLLAQRQSVFALTSLFEPFGLAPLEAAAAGLPLVVTEKSGLKEILKTEHQEYAILVDPEDPQDIARGLEELIGDKNRWKDLRSRCQKLVLKDYTWHSTGREYLKVIEELLQEPNARRPEKVLTIPTFFRQPIAAFDFTLEQLKEIYLIPEQADKEQE